MRKLKFWGVKEFSQSHAAMNANSGIWIPAGKLHIPQSHYFMCPMKDCPHYSSYNKSKEAYILKIVHSYDRKSVWFASIFFFSSGWQRLHWRSEDQINKHLVIFLNWVGLEAPGCIPDPALSPGELDNGINIFVPQRWKMKWDGATNNAFLAWFFLVISGQCSQQGLQSDTSSDLETILFLIHSWTTALPINPEANLMPSGDLTWLCSFQGSSSAPPGGWSPKTPRSNWRLGQWGWWHHAGYESPVSFPNQSETPNCIFRGWHTSVSAQTQDPSVLPLKVGSLNQQCWYHSRAC